MAFGCSSGNGYTVDWVGSGDGGNFTSLPATPTQMFPSGPSVIAVAPVSTSVTGKLSTTGGSPGVIFTIDWTPLGGWLTQMAPSAAVMPPAGEPSLGESTDVSSVTVPSGVTRATAPSSATQMLPSGPATS